ncbi:hypothetical protein [Sedimentibacter sp.]|uniref:hypothetical protein n=1 Tax=Sedimentibacter sp. TaxID=1960295 RepID=UPI0028A71F6F|nr:hypothetical protein [Sedimentibacter sp.]
MSDKNGTHFKLSSRIYSYSPDNEKSHVLGFRYFSKENTGSSDLLTKDVNYGVFKDRENTVEIFEGDTYLGMAAEDISVLYHCSENLPEELARIRIQFTGEVTLTGKIYVSVDDDFGYQVYFVADKESIEKIPLHIEDTRGQGGFRFINENLKEILGEAPFIKECEITIKDFNIHFAATEAVDTAELVSIKYIE